MIAGCSRVTVLLLGVEREGLVQAVEPVSGGGLADGRAVSGERRTCRLGDVRPAMGQDLDCPIDAHGLILAVTEAADRGEPVGLLQEH